VTSTFTHRLPDDRSASRLRRSVDLPTPGSPVRTTGPPASA